MNIIKCFCMGLNLGFRDAHTWAMLALCPAFTTHRFFDKNLGVEKAGYEARAMCGLGPEVFIMIFLALNMATNDIHECHRLINDNHEPEFTASSK